MYMLLAYYKFSTSLFSINIHKKELVTNKNNKIYNNRVYEKKHI